MYQHINISRVKFLTTTQGVGLCVGDLINFYVDPQLVSPREGACEYSFKFCQNCHDKTMTTDYIFQLCCVFDNNYHLSLFQLFVPDKIVFLHFSINFIKINFNLEPKILSFVMIVETLVSANFKSTAPKLPAVLTIQF